MQQQPESTTSGSKRMIMENEYIETLSIQFKRNRDFPTFFRICDHLTNLMSAIIRRNKYDRSVPFSDLMNHLYYQVDRWVLRWVPGEGKFYTYASVSIKHGAISYLTKEAQFHHRYQTMGDTPLDVAGSVSDRHDIMGLKESIAASLSTIHVRWHEPDIKESLQFIIHSITEHRGEAKRKPLMNTLRVAYGMEQEQAKFLIDWCQGAVRSALIEHFSLPFSKADVIRLLDKFSFLPDLVDTIGVDSTLKLMQIFAGNTIKFPTMSQIKRHQLACDAVQVLQKDTSGHALEGLDTTGVGERALGDNIEKVVSGLQTGVLEDELLYDAPPCLAHI